jgi:hypothetical protein
MVKTNLFAFRDIAVVQKLPGSGATIASCSIGILAAAMLLTGGLLENWTSEFAYSVQFCYLAHVIGE